MVVSVTNLQNKKFLLYKLMFCRCLASSV